jgi:hypothetical protein
MIKLLSEYPSVIYSSFNCANSILILISLYYNAANGIA